MFAGIYIFAVSQVMYYGNKIFGEKDTNLTPFVVLLLFSVSAAIVGSLIFGQAVMLFLNKKNKEAVQSASYSILWLFIITILFLIVLAIK